MTKNERQYAKSYRQRRQTLYRRQAEQFPKIENLAKLAYELDGNFELRKLLTEVDEKLCYRGSVRTRNGHIGLIFINPVVQNSSTTRADLAIDGTFKTSILDSVQVLNMFRIVNDVVCKTYYIGRQIL